MPVKLPGGNPLATGYWGGNPLCMFLSTGVGDKVRAAERDELILAGRPMDLWLPVEDTTPGVVACTCAKETAARAEVKCMSCFGTKLVPGYQHFQHELLHFSSAAYASYTLTNIERDTTLKPNRLRLTRGSTSGTIETPDTAYTNVTGADWAYDVAAYRKLGSDGITASFSTDSGATWVALTAINGGSKPVNAGLLRLRITLTRTAPTTDSPEFEIARLSHPQPERQNPFVLAQRSVGAEPVAPGQILVARSAQIETVRREQSLGRLLDWSSDAGWTVGLDFFDVTIAQDAPAAYILNRSGGQHPFLEHAYGGFAGQRVAIMTTTYSEQFKTLTRQAWADRFVQPGEFYTLVPL